MFYRKTLAGLGTESDHKRRDETASPQAVVAKGDKLATYTTKDGVVMRRIISSGAEELQDGSRTDAISSLNEARQRPTYLFPTLLIDGTITVLLALTGEVAVATMISGIVTGFLSLVAARGDVSRRNVVFAYQLDKGSESIYKSLVDAFDRLGNSDALWFVKASGEVDDLTAWKRNSGASQLIDKHSTAITYESPPGVQSNITPPCLKIEEKYLYFMPDRILVREGNTYGSVSYNDLRLATRPSRFIVEETVPKDCEIVGQTWKHPNKNGGPDRRFANNRQLPICLFEELGMISSSGLKALIMASARDAVVATEASLRKIGKSAKETDAPDHVLLTYQK